MEQDMVIEIMRKCKDSGASVDTIIADDDTTTIAKIKQSVNPDIKKKSDKNHVKKNIGNALYSIKNYKTRRFSSICRSVWTTCLFRIKEMQKE